MSNLKPQDTWTRFNQTSPWLFSVIFLVLTLVSVMALRQNNLKMIQLRSAVNKADEQNGDVEGALKDLREYVYSHMNTKLSGGDLAIYPPVQLKYRYERLVATERERVTAANAQVYSQAQIECEKLHPAGLSGSSRIPCVQDYVAKNGLKEQPIPDALYKFDFVSPKWSWDLAGLSVASAFAAFLLFSLSLISKWWRKLSLSHHLL